MSIVASASTANSGVVPIEGPQVAAEHRPHLGHGRVVLGRGGEAAGRRMRLGDGGRLEVRDGLGAGGLTMQRRQAERLRLRDHFGNRPRRSLSGVGRGRPIAAERGANAGRTRGDLAG
jgi:hypothetical protein